MSVVGYPTPGKQKARDILDAFCAGAPSGMVVDQLPEKLLPGMAVFYGVTPQTKYLWDQARAEKRDWIYIDNAYFDGCRQVYFRATLNRMQHHGTGYSDGDRLERLIYEERRVAEPEPWRETGNHIVLAPQSDQFMKVCAGYKGSWINDTLTGLRKLTTRTILARNWTSDKAEWYRQLHLDLRQAWAVVTYSSASAITALIAGVPAFVTAHDCIARCIAFTDLREIERRPPPEDDRRLWMAVIADNQWTLEEMRSGLCWKMLWEKL